ncbi:MAG: response regulator [Bacteroidota bacterium]
MSKYQVVIVDDHTLFRKGLNALIEHIPNVVVVGEASNGLDFLELLKVKKPDLVLMDINMPKMNGIEATREAIKKYPGLNVIALSMYGDELYYHKMIEAGVKGFLLKDADCSELEDAIFHVINGRNYFSQELLQNVIASLENKKDMNEPISKIKLSKREIQVVSLICMGLSTQQIAEKLFLSKRTVDRHRENLLLKTGCRNTASLVMYAIKNKLVNV